MSPATPKRKWKRAVLIATLAVLIVPVALFAALWSGLADRYTRRAVVSQMTKMTGSRVELGQFHFDPWRLRVTLGDLTIHGREPPGTPPFLHFDRLEAGLRVDSFWRRKISLGDVQVTRLGVHVRFERDGSSNVPAPPPRPSFGKPLRERLFDLVVQRLRLNDGELLLNDVRIPLVAEGGRFELAVDYSDAQGRRMYLGDVRWHQMELVARRYLPFSSDLAVRLLAVS